MIPTPIRSVVLQSTRRALLGSITPKIPVRTLSTSTHNNTNTHSKEVAADSKFHNISHRLFHYSSYGLFALLPAGIFLAPNAQFIDLALNALIPIHSHIGLTTVMYDYVYGAARKPAKFLLWIVTILTAVGLYKLNTEDVGISQSIKSLWVTDPKAQKN
eukprot:TRINITY_DN2699_c0_g1_i1.p1 TRINITY_DN2699_c0_g1~~TRINITY_DN2699_c0_g1_i1.p1  ORF type:complete len:159 (+),score=41.00 TRINITY_DN2699_c0_g1_i1:92-568(+)